MIDDGHKPGKKSKNHSKRKKTLEKGIAGNERVIDEHEEKIRNELAKPNPDYGLIGKWQRDIDKAQGNIDKKRGQLRRMQIAAGFATAGVIIWWVGKAASPLCGPAVVACAVVL